MKFTPIGWLIEIILIACFFIAFFFSVALFMITENSSYIADQYKENWSMNYIVDINITTNNCPSGYDEKALGVWTGFTKSGCVCTSENTIYQKAFDRHGRRGDDDCEDFEEDTGFTCKKLPEQDSIIIKKYKDMKFCLLRSNANFTDLFSKFKDIVSNKFSNISQTAFMNDKNYMNFLNTQGSINNLIDPNAIIDIKMINLTRFSMKNLKQLFDIDLSPENGYNKMSIDGENYLFIKRLGPSKILDVNNIIVDIHLFNEVLCSYLDISSPKNLYYSDYINFGGFQSCERMNFRNSNNTYNDNFKRQGTINFDFDKSVSKMDFYKSNGISAYYEKNNIKYNKIDNFSPSLVYEKYFYGLGCPNLQSIEDHIKIISNGFILINISSTFSFFTFIVCVLSFFFLICRLCENCQKCPKCFSCNIFLLTILTFINSILMIAYSAISRTTIKYLTTFAETCQVDYLNPAMNYENVKTSPNELRYYDNFYYPYRLGAYLMITEIAAFIYLLFYISLNCCTPKVNQEQNTVIVYDNRSKMPTHPNFEEAEMGRARSYISDKNKNDQMNMKF